MHRKKWNKCNHKYVNMDHKYVNMDHKYVNMDHKYINMDGKKYVSSDADKTYYMTLIDKYK